MLMRIVAFTNLGNQAMPLSPVWFPPDLIMYKDVTVTCMSNEVNSSHSTGQGGKYMVHTLCSN